MASRRRQEGFDAADRGDYVTLRSDREIDDFVDQVRRKCRKNSSLKKCVSKPPKKYDVRLTARRRDLSGLMKWTVQSLASARHFATYFESTGLKGHRSDPSVQDRKSAPSHWSGVRGHIPGMQPEPSERVKGERAAYFLCTARDDGVIEVAVFFTTAATSNAHS